MVAFEGALTGRRFLGCPVQQVLNLERSLVLLVEMCDVFCCWRCVVQHVVQRCVMYRDVCCSLELKLESAIHMEAICESRSLVN